MKEFWVLFAERMQKLLSVKSIITITLTVVLAVLTLRGETPDAQYMAIFTTIIGFYFGTQVQKDTSDTATK